MTKLKGFTGLKQALVQRDGPAVDMAAIRAAEIGLKLEAVTPARNLEPKSIYAQVPSRSMAKRKTTKKPKEGPKGKIYPFADPKLDWYLRRLG